MQCRPEMQGQRPTLEAVQVLIYRYKASCSASSRLVAWVVGSHCADMAVDLSLLIQNPGVLLA